MASDEDLPMEDAEENMESPEHSLLGNLSQNNVPPQGSLFAAPTISSHLFAPTIPPMFSQSQHPLPYQPYQSASLLVSTGASDSTSASGLQLTPEELARQAVDAFYAPKTHNDPNFKFKYPEAKPTPPGEDDLIWNKVYTAADSRLYNKNGKNAKNSAKFRQTRETYDLALSIHSENKEKMYQQKLREFDPSQTPAKVKTAAATMPPKKATAPKAEVVNEAREEAMAGELGLMSMYEKVKNEGRNRKTASAGPSSTHGTPAPPATMGESSASQSKPEKGPVKKKGTATAVRKKPGPKPGQKKKASLEEKVAQSAKGDHANETLEATPTSPTDSGSDDGGEYCICRGPDDHRMMVYCEGGCEDWYHVSCVKIDEADARELLDKYVCEKCKTMVNYTTWKPMCRYYNVGKHTGETPCRRAALVGQEPPSKYCSPEHARAFWEYVKTRVRDDDKPSMGGALNQEEVGMLAHNYKTAADWKRLGQKPRLPRPEGMDPGYPIGLDYVDKEQKKELDRIKADKEYCENQIVTYHDFQKLLAMVHARAKLALEHPDVEVKAICGYDNRLAVNEYELGVWKNTAEGKQAFETGILGPRTEETRKTAAHIPYPGQVLPEPVQLPDALDNICLKPAKKCKHGNWRDLNGQDFAYQIQLAEKRLEKLKIEEEEITDDAETREATKEYESHNVTIEYFD